MKIEDPEIVELVNQIEELERKLHAHPLHKVCHIIQNQLPSTHCSYKILLGSRKLLLLENSLDNVCFMWYLAITIIQFYACSLMM
jgi:hypothetical protein